MPINDGMMSSDSIEWATPPSLFGQLNSSFGFTLDVCATPHNAKVDHFFTVEDNGLDQDWGSNVCWMNPPYGRTIVQWMKRAYEASRNGATVVCLVPARTDTKWWFDYCTKADEIWFLRGRVRFIRDDGKNDAAPFPSAIVIFRPLDETRMEPKVSFVDHLERG